MLPIIVAAVVGAIVTASIAIALGYYVNLTTPELQGRLSARSRRKRESVERRDAADRRFAHSLPENLVAAFHVHLGMTFAIYRKRAAYYIFAAVAWGLGFNTLAYSIPDPRAPLWAKIAFPVLSVALFVYSIWQMWMSASIKNQRSYFASIVNKDFPFDMNYLN